MVSQGQDLYESAHLKSRDFYRDTSYYLAERGKAASEWQEGSSLSWTTPVRLSETPMEYGHYSNIGEDNPYVFGKLLGMSSGEIQRLADDGVIY
jgi:crotonobetainyl-CoA:carnitine CoA-transferase CaiB-like acyl-CoA transferase